MKKLIYFFIFIFISAPKLFSQDVHFSLYGEAPSVINPALTGVAYDFRANINYKSQWSGFNSGFLTYAANLESAIKHQKLKKTNNNMRTAYVAACEYGQSLVRQ